jgi:nicotinate-nucleotide pyrophosphorylase (carboxylating)
MTPLALAFTRPPPLLLIEPVVRRALEEDLGRSGDLTTDLIIPFDQQQSAKLVARAPGTLAGLVAAECVFRLIDTDVRFEPLTSDGANVSAGETVACVEGRARALLGAERVALNFVGHLSGVATATRKLVDAVEGTAARIVCTRKTTPGLRALEKYAVRCGGGLNHRFGLDDAVLIKDNHIAAAGGIRPAMERVRNGAGHMIKIEIEVDTLTQLEEALSLGADMILLDNMTPSDVKRAAILAQGRARLEASGGVDSETVRAIAEAGVDLISSGAITHSARNLDVALDFLPLL